MFGNTLDRALPFLMLPILTRWLSADDYGIIGTFIVIQTQLMLAISMAVPGAIARAWIDKGSNFNDEDFSTYIFNGILTNVLLFLLVGAILLINIKYISSTLHIDGQIIIIILVTTFLSAIHTIKARLWHIQQKPKKFTTYQVTRTLLNFGLSVFLLLFLWMDWRGRIGGVVLTEALSAIACFYLLVREEKIRMIFNKDYFFDILKFGLPLYPHSLSMLVITGADKILINHMEGLSSLGTYNVAYSVANIILFIAASVDFSVTPWIYQKLKSATQKDKEKVVQFIYTIIIIYFLIAIFIGIISEPLINLIVGKNFRDASNYLMVLSIAHAFFAAYRLFTIPISFSKRNSFLIRSSTMSAVIIILINLILISHLGTIGAAWGTLFGYSFLCLSTWYSSHKAHPLPWLGIFFPMKEAP